MIPPGLGLRPATAVLGRIGAILFASFCCLVGPVMAAVPEQECDPLVSVAELIANPGTHDGRMVWVVAHVRIGFENMSACPSEDRLGIAECLWLQIDDPPRSDPARYEGKFATWKQFNGRTVAIRARFDTNIAGHLWRWLGGLRDVAEVSGRDDGWSFSADGVVPRNSCAGVLPARTVNEKLLDGDHDEAIADLSRAIEQDPGNQDLRTHRASAKRQKGDHAGAVAEYTQLVDVWDESEKQVIFILRAWAREAAGDLDGAIADYSRAIELDPKFQDAYRGRGQARQKQGDSKGAAADFAREKRIRRGE